MAPSYRPDQHGVITEAALPFGGKETRRHRRKNDEKLLCSGLTEAFTLRSEAHMIR